MTPLPRLTLRRVSILLLLDAGMGYKAIAAHLEIHENTVQLHVRAIAKQLPQRRGFSPRDLVLLYCDRLLAENADIAARVRAAA